MKFLWSKLSLGGLYTDANANADNTDDADDNDNDTRRTEHDCTGSLPNEPKTSYVLIQFAGNSRVINLHQVLCIKRLTFQKKFKCDLLVKLTNWNSFTPETYRIQNKYLLSRYFIFLFRLWAQLAEIIKVQFIPWVTRRYFVKKKCLCETHYSWFVLVTTEVS